MRRLLQIGAATLAVSAVVAGPVFGRATATKPHTLTGIVGPGYTIKMMQGKHVAKIEPIGTYTITIEDKSAIHNFHLVGPGVNLKTGVSFVGTKVWHVKLKTGTYNFVCDPHKTFMKGKFSISNL